MATTLTRRQSGRTGPEPKCADCGHGTLAHNAIGGACTKCECGHFRPKAATAGTLTRRQSSALADKFAGTAANVVDSDTAATLFDLVCDLINHANGHPTWLEA